MVMQIMSTIKNVVFNGEHSCQRLEMGFVKNHLFLIWLENGKRAHQTANKSFMKVKILFYVLLCVLQTKVANGQSNGQPAEVDQIIKAIYHHDSIFWVAYNECDVEKMASYFTEDLEFYHDKAGPTFTLARFKESMRTGLCGKPDWRLRREPIQGTVKAFPLNNYGGVISGEHVFFINEKGKEEFLDGYGKFMQVWQYKDGKWKMSRIISYDHGPAPARSKD
jgi:hypothetical protein